MSESLLIPKDVLSELITEYSGRQIATILNTTHKTIYKYLHKYNLGHGPKGISSKCSVNHNFFVNIDNEYKAYWLGFIMADGCIHKQRNSYILGISLNKKDTNHLEKFKTNISSNKKLFYNTKNCTISLYIYSQKIYNDLYNLGCIERKSLTLEFPQNIRKDLIKHFIRGYFDGDGSLFWLMNYHYPRCKFISSLSFVTSLKAIIMHELDILGSIDDSGSNCYALVFSKRSKVIDVCDWMYKDANIYLDRKYNRYLQLMEENCAHKL